MSEAEMQVGRKRGTMPNLAAIASYWQGTGEHDLIDKLRGVGADWSQPFCFRCGWMAPMRADDYSEKWKDPQRRIDLAWNAASGWLERAHLHDHSYGGSNDPDNLVPLCPLCHEAQPTCASRGEGLAFVQSRAQHAAIRSYLQVFTDTNCRPVTGKPGKGQALRTLLRGGMAVAVAYAENES